MPDNLSHRQAAGRVSIFRVESSVALAHIGEQSRAAAVNAQKRVVRIGEQSKAGIDDRVR